MSSYEIYEESVRAVGDMKKAFSSSNVDPAKVEQKVSILKRAADGLKVFLGRMPGQFIDGVVKTAGTAAYPIVGGSLFIAAHWAHDKITELLQEIAVWLTRF